MSVQFTDVELKMLRQLRLRHEGWRSTRAIILVASIAALLFALWRIVRGQPDTSMVILFGLASAGLSYSLGGWSGRPEVSLLLKLAEAHQNAQAQQGAPADGPASRARG